MQALLAWVLAALMVSAMVAWLWFRQRRQSRMRELYRRLVRIRAEVPEGAEADLARLQANLEAVENEALDMLVNGRVAADSSLAIFLLLAQAVRNDIETGYQECQAED